MNEFFVCFRQYSYIIYLNIGVFITIERKDEIEELLSCIAAITILIECIFCGCELQNKKNLFVQNMNHTIIQKHHQKL